MSNRYESLNTYESLNQDNINIFNKLNFKEVDTNVYTLKINSKNRNVKLEPNPFNFHISFNQIHDESNPKAVISSKFDNIKRIQLSQILMPRYIPRDYMGEPFNGITLLYNSPSSVTLSYYPGININNTMFKLQSTSSSTAIYTEILELVDLSCKKISLVAEIYNNPYNLGTFVNYKTAVYSYLNINDNIYRILSISGNIINFNTTNNNYPPLPINLNNRLIIGDFYKNVTFMDTILNQIGVTSNTIRINKSNILNYQYLFQNQFLEYQVIDSSNNIIEQLLFKIINISPNILSYNITTDTTLIDVSNTFIIITGIWIEGLPNALNNGRQWPNGGDGIFYIDSNIYPNSSVVIVQFNYGVRDLLDEKIFYLNLDPYIPTKDVSTDVSVNNSFGVLFPSTQSKDYLYLKGEALESYTNSNLQKTSNKINFSLLDSNGQLLGNIYNKFFNLYSPNNYYSYFKNQLNTLLNQGSITQIDIDIMQKKYNNTFPILAYLPYYPDLNIIIKIEELDRKVDYKEK